MWERGSARSWADGDREDSRKLPAVGGEQKVDGVVVELRFRAKVGVDEFTDGCGAVW